MGRVISRFIRVLLSKRCKRSLPTLADTPLSISVVERGERSCFRDAVVRIRLPDCTGGVTLPIAHEKGRDLRLWCEFFRLAFPSPVRDACGPRGSSEYTQRAGVSSGVRRLQ